MSGFPFIVIYSALDNDGKLERLANMYVHDLIDVDEYLRRVDQVGNEELE